MTNKQKGKEPLDPLLGSDVFMMYCYKVLPCGKRYRHDWRLCPFAHEGETAKRRDPRRFVYVGIVCPDHQETEKCARGDDCPFTHNVFEYWLHPTRYRTQICSEAGYCRRKACFFAHSISELRNPTLDDKAIGATVTQPSGDGPRAPMHVGNAEVARHLQEQRLINPVAIPFRTSGGLSTLAALPTPGAPDTSGDEISMYCDRLSQYVVGNTAESAPPSLIPTTEYKRTLGMSMPPPPPPRLTPAPVPVSGPVQVSPESDLARILTQVMSVCGDMAEGQGGQISGF